MTASHTLLIRGARLLDARQELTGDLLIEGGRIAAIGPGVGATAAAAAVDQEIDGRGRAIIPGFTNTHTHAAMVLFRGYTDDVPLRQWLEQKIWPLERHLTAEHVRAGAALAGLEMLASGTTAFHDMYFQPQATASAVEQLGMRAVISQVFFEVFEKRPLDEVSAELEASLIRLRGFANVVPSVGPHAPYTVSLEGLAMAYRLAERLDLLVHFHLAETEAEMQDFRRQHGEDLVGALDRVGFLGPRLVAAHGIWLDEQDAERLARRGVTISHCPASNMKLGSGWTPSGPRALPYKQLRRAGVRVALGTDGAASNNNLDMFETMKLAALLQKHASGDPATLTAHEAFAMATSAGAEALRTDAGLIEVGRRADLVVLDLDRPYLAPGHDLVADLVYAGRPDCVDTVLVEGRVVLRGGRHPQQAAIIADARRAVADLLGRARGGGTDRAPLDEPAPGSK